MASRLPNEQMENAKGSKFSDLYKGGDRPQELERQEARRRRLLEEQKRLRASKYDDTRHIEKFTKRPYAGKPHHQQRRKKCIDENPLQLSEWMRERPEDLDQWLLVPCPKGKRCMLIATNGKSELYDKFGFFMQSFHTDLPGDSRAKQQVTILDCVLCHKTSKLFVLDMVAYGGQDLANCETQFRFYWVATKIEECQGVGDYELVPLPHYDMSDECVTSSCLEKFPQFDDNIPELDGFLFYHKEASYTFGTTPLVLWLFGFMVPEVLHLSVHSTYMMHRPSDYVDYLHYITQFDEALLKRTAKVKEKNQRQRRRQQKMDEDPDYDGDGEELDRMDDELVDDSFEDSNDTEGIIDRERQLELE